MTINDSGSSYLFVYFLNRIINKTKSNDLEHLYTMVTYVSLKNFPLYGAMTIVHEMLWWN